VIRAGDTIENPVTGERLVLRKTSAETNGAAVVLECFLQPNGLGAATHVHPYQNERFEVLKGTVGFALDGHEMVSKAGDRVHIPAGTSHRLWNGGDEEAHVVCEVSPALAFEQLIETMCGLAVDGKTDRKGRPNPLRRAVIARHHFDDARLPYPPAWMQRLVLALGAPLGRLLGYQPTYVRDGQTGGMAESGDV
jgi:quercetin dioxygenase-like cupin family protein